MEMSTRYHIHSRSTINNFTVLQHVNVQIHPVSKIICPSPQSLDLVAFSADVANIWVTGLRYLLAHPTITGGSGAGVGGGVLGERGVAVEGSLGGKMRSEWLSAEFAQVDEDGYGIVSENVAVATICKLCPGIKEAKVRRSNIGPSELVQNHLKS